MNKETAVFERAWIHFERKAPELDFKGILDQAVSAAGVDHYSELTYDQWMEVNRLQRQLIQKNEVQLLPHNPDPSVQMAIMDEWRKNSRNYGYGMD
jgi:hypothetical protein